MILNINYPTIEQFVSAVNDCQNKPAAEIDLDKLGVNGVIVKDTMDEYLGKRAVSSSVLVRSKISMKAAKYEYDKPENEVKEFNKEFEELGTLIHMALSEPELFKKVKQAPNADLRTTKGTRELVDFYVKLRTPRATYKGINKMGIKQLRKILHDERLVCQYYIVTENQMRVIEEIKKNYYTYGGGIIPALLKGAIFETSVYSKLDGYEFEVKARPDIFNTKDNIGFNMIGSLKSTSAKSYKEFLKQAREIDYRMKEGFYHRVISHAIGDDCVTVMIGLQTTPPYDIYLLFLDKESVLLGLNDAEYYLDALNDCFKSRRFPGMEANAEEGNRGIINAEMHHTHELPYQNLEN